MCSRSRSVLGWRDWQRSMRSSGLREPRPSALRGRTFGQLSDRSDGRVGAQCKMGRSCGASARRCVSCHRRAGPRGTKHRAVAWDAPPLTISRGAPTT